MTKIVAANWKMYLGKAGALELWQNLKPTLKNLGDINLIICPPFTSLADLSEVTNFGHQIFLGAQDCFWEDQGAYTGEISPKYLEALGCKYVIVGHSERRRYFRETDEMINKKIKAALANDLTPIFCVGETKEERQADKVKEIVADQLKRGLVDVELTSDQEIIIAYEPVWAIGTGVACSVEDAVAVHRLIIQELKKILSKPAPILYGGSVDEKNVADYVQEKEIDGVLVGGASTKLASFSQIIAKINELT